MAQQITKLISIIDQLLVWIKENPNISIPKIEKHRLLIALDQIEYRGDISDEEWEKIKPRVETRIIYKVDSLEKEFERQLAVIRKYYADAYPNHKKYESAFRKNTVIPTFNLPPNTKTQKDEITSKGGKRWFKCPNCQSQVLAKHKGRHKNKCPKRPAAKGGTKSKSAKFSGAPDPQNKVERNMDGSYGYHSFARENGRFGSHPSFDNMNDESGA